MIEPLIADRVQQWLSTPSCPAHPLLTYMQSAGKLRSVQIAALQTYLYLLLEGKNQTLTQLWMAGTFAKPATYDGPRSRMPPLAREVFATQPAAHTWYQLCKSQHPALATWLEENADLPDYATLTRELFYGWDNTDYVFSLPMGSGKTWLMAAIMYLNLYLGEQNPGDDRFAQNFCVLIPSAKKSSILPSLRSIERFDPAWVLPEPAAGRLRQLLTFEVLDAPKTAAKSNRIQNPNARKVAQHLMQPGLTGLVLVVNAEKVILDRIDSSTDTLINKTDDERDQAANELRDLIGRVPGLQLMVDEVHGAATSEIKLRQVMQRWHSRGNVHSVVGFSGTPFLEKPQEIKIGNHTLKQRQMSTVVFHYALTDAVRTFLKQPTVETAYGLSAEQIVRRGTQEFLSRYGDTVYPTGCSAKLAIYCGSIERLETEVAPLVEQLFPGQVLKYHRGNIHYKAPAGAENQFAALDSPASPYRVVLLVQIGKEGWDCPSLTGVILAQKGDSPANMVLQSACRCLREVVRGQRHTALIYLSQDNAQVLEAQLKNSQNTSIAALNAAAQAKDANVPMFDRSSWLRSLDKIPAIEAYQLRLHTQTLFTQDDPHTALKLQVALQHAQTRQSSGITTGTLDQISVRSTTAVDLGGAAEFAHWLHTLVHESAGTLTHADLELFSTELRAIFEALTAMDTEGGPDARASIGSANGACTRRYLLQAPQDDVRRLVRLAFWRLREFATEVQPLDQAQNLLLLTHGKLPATVAAHDKLYPQAADVQKIVVADASGQRGADIAHADDAAFAAARTLLEQQGLGHMLAAQSAVTAPAELAAKDHTFHYLPYDFAQSGLELGLLQALLKTTEFQDSGLEIYFNGARHLTEFRIDCFQQVDAESGQQNKRWQRLGAYTPDFVMIQRGDHGAAHKVLIIETKGAGFSEQAGYALRKHFVSTEFLRLNNAKFGYPRFDFKEIMEPANKDYRSAAFELLSHAQRFFAPNKPS
jgi:type III restriction enzyme